MVHQAGGKLDPFAKNSSTVYCLVPAVYCILERLMLRLTDLREILRYVPRFRDKVFVIAVDGAVIESENFGNLLLDISLLRSLRVEVALVHGAGLQVRKLAEQTGQTPSNV